jgi:peroxisomal coenzyme A diphosphatase NUDT7
MVVSSLLTPAQYATDVDVPSLGMSTYRMHRFRSTASPIKGLTSDILVSLCSTSSVIIERRRVLQIKVAEIAYAQNTAYERYAPGQIVEIKTICHLLEENESREATPNGHAIAA